MKKINLLILASLLLIGCTEEKSSQELKKEYEAAVTREKIESYKKQKEENHLPTFTDAMNEAVEKELYDHGPHIYYENGHRYILHFMTFSHGGALGTVHDPECPNPKCKARHE